MFNKKKKQIVKETSKRGKIKENKEMFSTTDVEVFNT